MIQKEPCGDAGPAPFLMRVAGLVVEVRPLFAAVRRLCGDYVVPAGAEPDLVIAPASADIDRERSLATEGAWSDDYLETLAVLRALALAAPARSRLLMHGAVLAYGGAAYMFCAPSGTGKSTHLRLWREFLGEGSVRVVNGDKPLVEVLAEGPAVAYGTPWCGKEGWHENASAPLAGICFIERAEPGQSRIERLEPAGSVERALRQTFLAEESAEVTATTLELLDTLLARTPLWLLYADMSDGAVRASFEAMTGEDFDAARARREEMRV